jgi:hypothetical protein
VGTTRIFAEKIYAEISGEKFPGKFPLIFRIAIRPEENAAGIWLWNVRPNIPGESGLPQAQLFVAL